jgi:hypothetical protein
MGTSGLSGGANISLWGRIVLTPIKEPKWAPGGRRRAGSGRAGSRRGHGERSDLKVSDGRKRVVRATSGRRRRPVVPCADLHLGEGTASSSSSAATSTEGRRRASAAVPAASKHSETQRFVVNNQKWVGPARLIHVVKPKLEPDLSPTYLVNFSSPKNPKPEV